MIRLTKYIVTFAAAAIISSPAFAQIDYFEDFEGLDASDPAALAGAGWLIFGNVFSDYPGCSAHEYGYGTFAAPNGGPGFSSIANGNTGQALNAYSDYNNGDQATKCIETNLFQEVALTAADAGIYEFMFNTQEAFDETGAPIVIEPPAETYGFVKLLDPNNGWATVWMSEPIYTTTTGAKSYTVTLNADADGLLLQFGFSTKSSGWVPTGRWYDNVSFALEGTYQPPTGPSPVKYDGIPIPRWALLIMAGLLMYFGRTKLLARKET